jgi:hypothetical protein
MYIKIGDVNLGDISKPVIVLLKKMSNAAGVIYKPFEKVLNAKADAIVARTRTDSQIEIDLKHRALNRFISEETKKQKNIEAIIQQALPQVEEQADPGNVEDDWIFNFVDRGKLISDTEMQTLWSRILAGEANAPGSFSKRTVNFLASLDKRDAQMFTQLCTFIWEIGGQLVPLVYEPEDELYEKHDITTNSLEHLDDIGLIQFDTMNPCRISYKIKTDVPVKFKVFYYEKPTQIILSGQSGYVLYAGDVRLTKVGQELASICGSTPDEEFRNDVLTKWKQWAHIKEETTEDQLSQPIENILKSAAVGKMPSSDGHSKE